MLWIRGDALKSILILHPETRSNVFWFNHTSEEGGMTASEEVSEPDPYVCGCQFLRLVRILKTDN